MKNRLLFSSLFLAICILSISFLTTSASARAIIYQPQFEGMSSDSVLSRYSGLPRSTFTLASLDMHPDRVYPDYFGVQNSPFQTLLNVFVNRQGVDDNFSVRWTIKSTGETQVIVLDSLKAVYEQQGFMDWDMVDTYRRKISTRIKAEMATRGIDPNNFEVRWGRKNQIIDARKRDNPYIIYELRLARQLNMSALASEIGTVETFNQDHLVSSVGARGRYQFMPAVLRTFNINRYKLKNRNQRDLQVREEYHPLLTMEPSAIWTKGYANAVGHEVPGISSYHTGPGNLYKVFEYYLDNNPPTHVMDAFVWGLTDGYPIISANTSFKEFSKGYVPSAYGAMKAVENMPIDPREALTCERVVLQSGQSIYLSELLPQIAHLFASNESYEAFRKMNPHIPLSEGFGGEITASNDVKLTALAQGETVHIFLPIGATQALPNLIDGTQTFVYNHTTFLEPKLTGEYTQADDEYERLVLDIGNFGYHQANKDKLITLAAEFEDLYNRYPTQFRKMQLKIIRIHKQVWSTDAWRRVANKVEAKRGVTETVIEKVRETFDF